MSDPDPIDAAFADWRAATDSAAPAPALVERIVRAAAAPPPTLLGPLLQLGRHTLLGAALAAALLVFAAARSVHTLEDKTALALIAGVQP